ncbi:MAG TPA: hypothetical protein DCY13_14395 [Verrucomicrobiales bacterium]|nr:hypothetical protein [Verrucomicrobiales bacterium]
MSTGAETICAAIGRLLWVAEHAMALSNVGVADQNYLDVQEHMIARTWRKELNAPRLRRPTISGVVSGWTSV